MADENITNQTPNNQPQTEGSSTNKIPLAKIPHNPKQAPNPGKEKLDTTISPDQNQSNEIQIDDSGEDFSIINTDESSFKAVNPKEQEILEKQQEVIQNQEEFQEAPEELIDTSDEPIPTTNQTINNQTEEIATEENLTEDSKNPLSVFKLPSLRTYKHDVKEAVKSQNLSTARILLQEQRKKAEQVLEDETNSLKNTKNKAILFISIALISIAGGVFGYIYYLGQIPQEPTTRFVVDRPQFIEVDTQTEVSVTLRNNRDILNDVQRIIVEPIQQNSIHEIYLISTKENFEDGQRSVEKTPISTTNFFQLLETRAPNSLLRSLENEFMLGVYGAEVGEPFVLLKVRNYENAFSSMLSWESGIARDLQPIFFLEYDQSKLSSPPIITGPIAETEQATTSTSTQEILEPQINFDPTTFTDDIMQNKDVRKIANEFGETVFFYSFIDPRNLIFASSEETLTEVLRRLRSASLIR